MEWYLVFLKRGSPSLYVCFQGLVPFTSSHSFCTVCCIKYLDARYLNERYLEGISKVWKETDNLSIGLFALNLEILASFEQET